jgi:hypothetical protein
MADMQRHLHCEQALQRVQRDLRKYIPEGRMLSEELLAERRHEAARESAPAAHDIAAEPSGK